MISEIAQLNTTHEFHGEMQENAFRVLVIASTFPSRTEPSRGIFVKERVKALAALPGVEVRVVAPIPWFPPIKRFSRWYRWSQYPDVETLEGLTTYHPKYFLPPKLGGFVRARLMYPAVLHTAKALQRDFDFDLIDGHFVYPSGVVAARLGRRFGRPVVMTGRGEDMLRFPELPIIGRSIRGACRGRHRFVALSQEIADAFIHCGADPQRVFVIPNGVDTTQFAPIPKVEARRRLNLSRDGRIVVSVGDLQERKGFHILIKALSEIQEEFSDTSLYIVGGPAPYGQDYRAEIERCIRDNNLVERVHLVGRVPHNELAEWYSAADLFALLSSREGSPNVLLEALSCGTPAVATAVGGISEELADLDLGVLVRRRDVPTSSNALRKALSQTWDREAISRKMQGRTWSATAARVGKIFLAAQHEHRCTNGKYPS